MTSRELPQMTVHRKQAILTNGQPMSPGALDGRTNYSSGALCPLSCTCLMPPLQSHIPRPVACSW